MVNGAWTDDPTQAARAAYEAGHRVDHDAGMRQARTAMVAGRAGKAWAWNIDADADRFLQRLSRLDARLIEDMARFTSRTYDEVLARWRHHHPEAGT